VTLPYAEVRHASRVLRKGPGDEIVGVDGLGGWYRIVLDQLGKHTASGHIIERREEVGEPPYELTLAVAVLKSRTRFETLLEKAVELGASIVAPILTARTERESIREERSEGILTAAMKQCGRSRLPDLRQPVSLEEFLQIESSSTAPGISMICHERAGSDSTFNDALRDWDGECRITTLVGPEGGFTDQEIMDAVHAGFSPVWMGERRLRTETAAISVLAAVMLAYDR